MTTSTDYSRFIRTTAVVWPKPEDPQQSLPLDRFSRQILDFCKSWLPYGGGSATEIFEQFGLTERRFFERVESILELTRREELIDYPTDPLSALCMERLYRPSAPTAPPGK